ncbi:hypothetical protein GLYMA_04G239600v4 [Glycine max]|uniref:SnoaL-like domain-containing protein n=1 Tax=Glycine max TaxID=3847 RepID=K7KLZ9_SOYBN|nr:uncharacterized protein LOC102667509 [Glycine max]KAH1112947.1 hypothetical protein GYH30_010926 [Glycine max]KRH64522.1 hypothetical protein GLYMA_04G239600v4 [Glycine max]|eukprot:XP_006578938.1 uncharacterized protein LOC102667509 [Glycine max]
MASLPQMSTTLGACMSSNKTINPRPCIAQLNNNNNNKRSTPFSNLIANHQIVNGTLFPFALVGQKKPIIELWKQCQNEKWKARAGKNPEFLPHSDVESVVKEFYDAFNKKDIEKLKQLVSDDCEYQDYLFYNPYKGKEQIIEFWQEVMDALGPNIKIAVGKGDIRVEEDVRVEDVKESKPMATVFWHLEWGDDKNKLPFTKGCRFFWFTEDKEGRLIISKVTGLEELPLKPGEIVLNMLKAIRTFLDSYPPMAKALLNSPAFRDD